MPEADTAGHRAKPEASTRARDFLRASIVSAFGLIAVCGLAMGVPFAEAQNAETEATSTTATNSVATAPETELGDNEEVSERTANEQPSADNTSPSDSPAIGETAPGATAPADVDLTKNAVRMAPLADNAPSPLAAGVGKVKQCAPGPGDDYYVNNQIFLDDSQERFVASAFWAKPYGQLQQTSFNYSVGGSNFSFQIGRFAKIKTGLNPATEKPYYGIEVGEPGSPFYLNSDAPEWVVETCVGDEFPCTLKNTQDPDKKIRFSRPPKNETTSGNGHFIVDFIGFTQPIDTNWPIQWKFAFDANDPVGNAKADSIKCPEDDWPVDKGGPTAPIVKPAATPDLSIEKEPRLNKILKTAANSDAVAWKVLVKNNGVGESAGFRFLDTLDSTVYKKVTVLDGSKISADNAEAEAQILSPTPGMEIGETAGASGMSCRKGTDDPSVTCKSGPLAEGASKTFIIVAELQPTKSCVANTVDLEPFDIDPVTTNNSASAECPKETIALEKLPAPDQDPNIPGDQKRPTVTFDDAFGTTSVYYRLKVANTGDVETQVPHDLVDSMHLPAGVEVTGGEVRIDDQPLSGITVGAETTIPKDKVPSIPAMSEKVIEIRVDLKAPLAQWADTTTNKDLECAESLPADTATLGGALNSVHMDGENDEPAKETNNNACVSLNPDITIEKTPAPQAQAEKLSANGTATLTYHVLLTNRSAEGAATVSKLLDQVELPAALRVSAPVSVSAPAQPGVTITGLRESIPAAEWVDGAKIQLAEKIVLEPGKTQDLSISVPVYVEPTTTNAAFEKLTTCTVDAANGFRGGVVNHVASTGVDSDGPSNNHACIPLAKADPAQVIIQAAAYDAASGQVGTSTLTGAEFQVVAVGANGKPKGQPIPLQAKPDGSFSAALARGTYQMLQTKAPADGYELLPTSVQFKVLQDLEQGYQVQAVAGAGSPLVSYAKDENSGDLIISVADIRTGVMPKTGPRHQAFWMSLALLIAVGMVLLNVHARANVRRAVKAGE